MDEEHHSTGMVAEGGIGVGSKIINKVVHTGVSIDGGDGLFGSNVTETEGDGVVNGDAVVYENADDVLDVFEAFSWKDRFIIGRVCILEFGPKCRLCMGVGGVLFSAFEVVEPEEGGVNIARNGQIDRSFAVIRFKVMPMYSCAFQSSDMLYFAFKSLRRCCALSREVYLMGKLSTKSDKRVSFV